MGKLINQPAHKTKKGAYTNIDALDKLVPYILRTNKEKEDLLGYGGVGVSEHVSAEGMVHQMKQIQNCYNIDSRGGRRAAHMTFTINEEEFTHLGCNVQLLNDAMKEIANHVYRQGHQVVYGTHLNKCKEGGRQAFAHVHLGINSINYMNGKKYHNTKAEQQILENDFNEILKEHEQRSAVTFYDAEVYRNRNN